MYKVTKRPLDKAEIRLLNLQKRQFAAEPALNLIRRASFKGFAVGTFVFLPGWTFRGGQLWQWENLAALLISGLAFFLVYLFYEMKGRRTLSILRKEIDEILDGGWAVEHHVVASRYVEFEEYEDEGASFVFDLGNGQLLLLFGQQYYDTSNFPNDNFRMIEFFRSNGEHHEDHFSKKGKELEPIREIKMDIDWKLSLPYGWRVFPGDLDNLEAALEQIRET